MKLNKIKTYNLVELKKEYKERVEKLKQYELDLRSGKEKDSAKISFLRKDVARILTLINQKIEMGEAEVIIKEIKEEKVTKDNKEAKDEKKVEEVKETKKESAQKVESEKETIKNTK